MSEQKKLPFVWELNYNGVISHAIGSIHAFPFTEKYVKSIANYVLDKECVMMEYARTGFPIRKAKKIMNIKAKETLEKLTSHEKNKVSKKLETSIRSLKKWTIDRVFGELYDRSCPHKSSIDGLDTPIYWFAFTFKIPRVSLETVAERYKSFINPDHSRELKQIINYRKGPEKFYTDLFQAYIDGKIKQLNEFAFDEDNLTERNKIMVERSIPLLEKPSLVAVGAVHFTKGPSMLTMYKEKGIDVKRV